PTYLHVSSGHVATVLMIHGMKHCAVAELLDGILEVTGHPEYIDRLLNQLQITPLLRESTALGDRVIVDAIALGADNVFDTASALDLRASEGNLERAVLALGEEGLACIRS